MASLKELFVEHCFVEITPKIAKDILNWCIAYEVRDEHPEAFNTPLLGVNKAYFFPKDSDALFDILNIDKNQFTNLIKICPNINKEFKVVSNAFNILCIWTCYCLIHSKLNKSDKQEAMVVILKMLQYSFFTSLVGWNFKHGANIDIMQLTIEELSGKFGIVQDATNTWKLLIEAKCKETIKENSIHWKALNTFSPDMGQRSVAYVISDLQTGLRKKIVLIKNLYYQNVEKNNRIVSTTIVDNTGEEKTVKELTATYDIMIANLQNRVLNINQFINHEYIKFLSKMITNVRPDALRTVLTQFSNLATLQYQKHKGDEISKDGKYLIGYRALIAAIIQRTYRECVLNKTNMRSRIDILDKATEIYRSSRISDPGILQVKDSVDRFVGSLRVTQRPATQASLKIAFILMVILFSFDSL